MFGASTIELEIMELLAPGGGLYGLEMVKASDKIKRGTVYVYLSRMEDKEWVRSEAEKVASMPGLPRRRYWLTDAGKRILDRAVDMKKHFEAWA
ncbi:hypothetical protein G6L37_34560 [Agrobacterium rubi]|nr:hypothetical protein [Agrobacterium rubi]NTF23690.1 hypothetical protein [Agrobacterium rubi]